MNGIQINGPLSTWRQVNGGAKFVHCLLPLDNPHYGMPMNKRPPEQSRSEPEIIPPGFDEHWRREPPGMWVRIDEHDGVRRVVIGQPGPTTIVLGLLVLCLIAGIAFLVVAGLLLLWIPVVIAGILIALATAAIRHHSRLLRARWLSKR
jgi:Flp pilus assembly protein TadB